MVFGHLNDMASVAVVCRKRKMQTDSGKLFVGGISWDTDEDRLKEYFNAYGDVVEAVIMKDRTTGRGRGFGFIVFADPSVADRVIREKHNIDGRMVSLLTSNAFLWTCRDSSFLISS